MTVLTYILKYLVIIASGLPFFRFPVDHIFHSKRFLLQELTRMPEIGSDHFPMYIRLCYQPQRENLQRSPIRPDREDLKEARKTIEEAEEEATSDSR